MTPKEKALQSVIREAKGLIRRNEGKFAKSVIADFNDAVQQSDNPHKTAFQWLRDYRKPGHCKSVPFDHPKQEWRPYELSKNSEFWDWTNLLLDQQRYGKKAPAGFKIEILKKMSLAFDEELRDNFRMTLCQVLRYEKSQDVRREAIYLLAKHFDWSTIEWTFWLHEKRRKEDISTLITAEAWCRRDVKDEKTLEETIKAETKQLIREVL